MKRFRAVALLLGLTMAGAAFTCQNSGWETTTYQTLSAAKAAIDCASAGYNHNDAQITQYCAGAATPSALYLPQTVEVQTVILKAGVAKDAAVNAMIAYEAGKNATGATNTATLQANVNAAVAALTADVTAIATLVQKGGK